MVLQHGHVCAQGDAWYALAELEIKEKAYAKADPPTWPDVDLADFGRPIDYYNRALECFAYADYFKREQDAHYYLALIHHQLDDDAEHKKKRDAHARRVLELQALLNKSINDHLESNAPLFLHDGDGDAPPEVREGFRFAAVDEALEALKSGNPEAVMREMQEKMRAGGGGGTGNGAFGAPVGGDTAAMETDDGAAAAAPSS